MSANGPFATIRGLVQKLPWGGGGGDKLRTGTFNTQQVKLDWLKLLGSGGCHIPSPLSTVDFVSCGLLLQKVHSC